MAFSPSETLEGFEYVRGPHEIKKFPAAASTAFTKGAPVVLSTNNLIALAANGSADILGVCLESKTTPAYTDDDDDHLVSVLLARPGTVFRANIEVPFEDLTMSVLHTDGTKFSVAAVATLDGDDKANGHPIICYEGPGKGEWRVIIDYDHAGDADVGALAIFVNRPFKATLTTASKFIILGTNTDAAGVLPGMDADLGGVSASKVAGADSAGSLMILDIDNLGAKGWVECCFTNTVFQGA